MEANQKQIEPQRWKLWKHYASPGDRIEVRLNGKLVGIIGIKGGRTLACEIGPGLDISLAGAAPRKAPPA